MTRITTFLATAACFSSLVAGTAFSQTAPVEPAVMTAPVAGTKTLTVTVSGVRSANGTIRAQLVKADYTAGKASNVDAIIVPAVQGTTTLTFTGLSDGDYAVQMFHDEDGDGEMKTNLFGIPSEGYGFSNNARAAFGPPKFADMKVAVSANTTTTATLAY